MAFLHSAQLLWTDCGYPRWSVCFTLPNAIFFYMLFNDFYNKSYKTRNDKKIAKKAAEDALVALQNGETTKLLQNGSENSLHTNSDAAKKDI